MRSALAPLLNTRVRCVGTYTDVRRGDSVLLTDVYVEGVEETIGHLWLNLSFHDMARPVGSRIQLLAYVRRYTRYDGSEDYGLMCIHVEEE